MTTTPFLVFTDTSGIGRGSTVAFAVIEEFTIKGFAVFFLDGEPVRLLTK